MVDVLGHLHRTQLGRILPYCHYLHPWFAQLAAGRIACGQCLHAWVIVLAAEGVDSLWDICYSFLIHMNKISRI